MNQITIITILQKIGSICKEVQLETIPLPIVVGSESPSLEIYFKTLQKIRGEFMRYRNLEQQYFKLENMLQKQEMDLRKRLIQIEQQLKLYTDTLKIQVEELQKEKIDLLENSKAFIKELKKTNQSLYFQLHTYAEKERKDTAKSNGQSPQKTQKSKRKKSLTNYKSKHDKSIKEIIKTQHFERGLENCESKKQNETNNKIAVNSIFDANYKIIGQNAKTFQLIGDSEAKKEKMGSRKRNKNLYSGYNLLNFVQINNRKATKGEKNKKNLSKSPGKMSKRNEVNQNRLQNISKLLWKQKKANKSIISVYSMQPNLSGKKETI